MRSFSTPFLLLSPTILQSGASAQNWQPAGRPFGGIMDCLYQDTANGLACCGSLRSGAFRSGDNGLTWSRINPAIGDNALIRFAKSGTGALLAGSDGGDVYQPTDEGASWSSLGLSVQTRKMEEISDGDLLVSGRNEGIQGLPSAGGAWKSILRFLLFLFLFSSSLCSQDWRQTAGPCGGTISCFGCDTASAMIFAGTFLIPDLFRSTDEGMTWQAMPGISDNLIYSLIVDAQGRLYAATSGGVYRSTDGGAGFKALGNGLGGAAIGRIMATRRGMLFAVSSNAGIFRSTNDGGTWRAVNNGINLFRISSIAEGDSGSVLIGTFGWGIYRSTDNGDHWAAANDGITNYSINTLFRRGDGTFLAAADDGIMQSSDDGQSWLPFSSLQSISRIRENRAGDLFFISPSDILRQEQGAADAKYITNGLSCNRPTALLPLPNGDLLAGLLGGLGIHRSSDRGDHWRLSNPGLTAGIVDALTRLRSGIIYAGLAGGALQHSTSDGKSWIPDFEPGNCADVNCIAETRNGTLFAGSIGILRSRDGGHSWNKLAGGPATDNVLDLRADGGDKLYALTSTSLSRSTDEGESWEETAPPVAVGYLASFTALSGGTLLVGPAGGDILRSTDDGATWIDVAQTAKVNGFYAPAEDSIFVLTETGLYFSGDRLSTLTKLISSSSCNDMAAGADGVLYLATRNSGILRSADHGGSWDPFNAGLPTPNIRRLAFAGDGSLLAGTYGAGIFRSSILTSVHREERLPREPKPFLRASPNPFTTSTMLEFSIPGSAPRHVQLKIVDLHGRDLALLADGDFLPGSHRVNFTPPGILPTGLYFCVLRSGMQRIARKILLAR